MSAITAFCLSVGHVVDLLLSTIPRLHHVWKRRAATAGHLYSAGVGVVHVVVFVGFFIGMVVALQTGIELSRIGQQDQIGTIVTVSMAREMGPFITGTILAATVGSALAAELATMAVSDELSALEVLSVDRISFLVVPRLVAVAVMCPVLTIFCNTVGVVGGGFVADGQLNVSLQLYYESAVQSLQEPTQFLSLPKDVYCGLFKSLVFGIIIAAISCDAGLRAHGGALGVGNATRQAVRDSIIAIIIANYFMTWFFYQ